MSTDMYTDTFHCRSIRVEFKTAKNFRVMRIRRIIC